MEAMEETEANTISEKSVMPSPTSQAPRSHGAVDADTRTTPQNARDDEQDFENSPVSTISQRRAGNMPWSSVYEPSRPVTAPHRFGGNADALCPTPPPPAVGNRRDKDSTQKLRLELENLRRERERSPRWGYTEYDEMQTQEVDSGRQDSSLPSTAEMEYLRQQNQAIRFWQSGVAASRQDEEPVTHPPPYSEGK
ncbi:hypothetical protein H0H92_015120 [Tricholoma furcatifolium]|nr:hypothetical protein H0H92_015120 [Tricholoma furcatifolium]